MTTPTRTKFRPRQRVRLSDEGREKRVAPVNMRGIVLTQQGPLVTVIEDGHLGTRTDYHQDYLERIPLRKLCP